MKAGLKNKTLPLFIGLVILFSITAATTQCTHAADSTKPSESMDLGNPFLVEHFQGTAGKPEATTNKSISSSFTANGIINETINISAEGNSSETFRNNDTSYIQGKAKIVTENKDTALHDFYAIGNDNPDGSFVGSGVAVFDDGAKGELSFLSNSVAVYKDQIDKNGAGTFIMWHWR